MENPCNQQNMECMDLDSTANFGQCTETTANSNLQCEVPDIIMVEDSPVSPHEPNGCWPVMNEVFITDMDTTVPQVPETIAQDHCYYGENIGLGTCTAEISTQTDMTVNDLEVLEQGKKDLMIRINCYGTCFWRKSQIIIQVCSSIWEYHQRKFLIEHLVI